MHYFTLPNCSVNFFNTYSTTIEHDINKKNNAYIYKTLSYTCSCIMLTHNCLVLVKLFSKTVFMSPSTETSSYSEETLC